ncbi:Hypothetical Protein FCC1311_040822 [Hondaea fermentalgiana]|uniref:Ricin B lectin domain-containing protein n=1 Tax=Hondaea fermentalgiana TaxID=2315210 RepID=A0A2R5GBZ9_9STRA|nr:Hypothetical Protein FCC1311_040822 [Hondaea fermentalgiana]|eukprot:GBG27859.1 Hypothetical Protein FCC1311_040822 [Hondaea fermentalgiana]
MTGSVDSLRSLACKHLENLQDQVRAVLVRPNLDKSEARAVPVEPNLDKFEVRAVLVEPNLDKFEVRAALVEPNLIKFKIPHHKSSILDRIYGLMMASMVVAACAGDNATAGDTSEAQLAMPTEVRPGVFTFIPGAADNVDPNADRRLATAATDDQRDLLQQNIDEAQDDTTNESHDGDRNLRTIVSAADRRALLNNMGEVRSEIESKCDITIWGAHLSLADKIKSFALEAFSLSSGGPLAWLGSEIGDTTAEFVAMGAEALLIVIKENGSIVVPAGKLTGGTATFKHWSRVCKTCWKGFFNCDKCGAYKVYGLDTIQPYLCFNYKAAKTIRLKDTNNKVRCLDVNTNTNNVYLYSCHGRANQRWYLQNGKIKSVYNRKSCLKWRIFGGNAFLGSCDGIISNDEWTFTGNRIKTNTFSTKCLYMDPSDDNNAHVAATAHDVAGIFGDDTDVRDDDDNNGVAVMLLTMYEELADTLARDEASQREHRSRHLLEEIEISPWERWARYGVWPTRMLVHGFCIASLMCYVLWIEAGILRNSVSYERNAYNLLFRGALQHDEFSRHGGFGLDAEDFHANDFVLFNTSQTHKQIARVVRNYFRLEVNSVDYIMVAGSPASPSLPFPRLLFTLRNGTKIAHNIHNSRDLGPLSKAQSREEISVFLHALEAVHLDMWLESVNPDPGILLSEPCVRWLFVARFRRERGAGPFFGHLSSEGGHTCFASIARVARGVMVLQRLKDALTGNARGTSCSAGGPCWQDVNFRDKLTILNFWNLLAIVADLACLVYALIQMVDAGQQQPDQRDLVDQLGLGIGSDANKVLLGLSCALHLISLLEYAEYGLVNYLFLQVNRMARVEALKTLLGVLPITIAYMLVGVALYGDSVSRFGSARNTAITLFSLCLGDEIWPTFRDLEAVTDVPHFVSVVYVLSFVVLHFNVVGMCMLAVVEHAFIEHGLWLLDEPPGPSCRSAEIHRASSSTSFSRPPSSLSMAGSTAAAEAAAGAAATSRELLRRSSGVSLYMFF